MDRPFIALELNDSYKPVSDGVAVCVENYARHLLRLGTEAAVATPWAPDWTDIDEFPVFRYLSFPVPGWKPYRAGLPEADPAFHRRVRTWLADAAGTEVPVILHAHSPFSSAAIGRRLRRRLRSRGRRALLVATLHSKYHADFARTLPSAIVEQITRVIRRSFDAADLVWVPNRGTERTLRSYGYESAAEIVGNGADLDPPDDVRYAELRARGAELLGVDDREHVLLFVGQQRWEKNVGLVLNGFAHLERTTPRETNPRRLVLVGDGPDRGAIATMARNLGLIGHRTRPGVRRSAAGSPGATDDAVILYGHVADRRVLEAIYARADLFVFPSLYDNAPLVVREAAAFRTPSILARGSDAAGDTIDRRNAFHVEAESEALAALISELERAPRLVEEVAGAARHEVFRSWAEVVDEVRERYADALGPT